MISPTSAGANRTPAIGTPDAKLFFDPQNKSTIESSRESPSLPPIHQQVTSTNASRPLQRTNCPNKLITEHLVQRPSMTAWLNAVYTTRRIELRSTQPTNTLCRTTQAPIQGLARCPTTNGRRSCPAILLTASIDT